MNGMSTPVSNKRSATRLPPELGTLARIDVEPWRGEDAFLPSIIALVPETSITGVGLVLISTEYLQPGNLCVVQIGDERPVRAEVRWRRSLDAHTIRIGLLYQD